MNKFVFFAVTIVLAGNVSVLTACTPAAFSAYETCMESTGINLNGLTDMFTGLQTICRGNSVEQLLSCFQPLLNECKNSTNGGYEVVILQHLTISNIRSSYNYVCNHLDEIKDQGQCIMSNAVGFRNCFMGGFFEIMTQDPNNLACRVKKYIEKCAKDTFSSCGNIGDMGVQYIQLALPGICN